MLSYLPPEIYLKVSCFLSWTLVSVMTSTKSYHRLTLHLAESCRCPHDPFRKLRGWVDPVPREVSDSQVQILVFHPRECKMELRC